MHSKKEPSYDEDGYCDLDGEFFEESHKGQLKKSQQPRWLKMTHDYNYYDEKALYLMWRAIAKTN